MIKFITDLEGSYCPPASFELAGEALSIGGQKLSAADLTCIKCADGVYLLLADGTSAIYREKDVFDAAKADPSLKTDELSGWDAVFIFSPGKTAELAFKDGAIGYDGEETAAAYSKLGENLYLVSADTEDGKLAMVVNTARFLFYGEVCGRAFGGYIEF